MESYCQDIIYSSQITSKLYHSKFIKRKTFAPYTKRKSKCLNGVLSTPCKSGNINKTVCPNADHFISSTPENEEKNITESEAENVKKQLFDIDDLSNSTHENDETLDLIDKASNTGILDKSEQHGCEKKVNFKDDQIVFSSNITSNSGTCVTEFSQSSLISSLNIDSIDAEKSYKTDNAQFESKLINVIESILSNGHRIHDWNNSVLMNKITSSRVAKHQLYNTILCVSSIDSIEEIYIKSRKLWIPKTVIWFENENSYYRKMILWDNDCTHIGLFNIGEIIYINKSVWKFQDGEYIIQPTFIKEKQYISLGYYNNIRNALHTWSMKHLAKLSPTHQQLSVKLNALFSCLKPKAKFFCDGLLPSDIYITKINSEQCYIHLSRIKPGQYVHICVRIAGVKGSIIDNISKNIPVIINVYNEYPLSYHHLYLHGSAKTWLQKLIHFRESLWEFKNVVSSFSANSDSIDFHTSVFSLADCSDTVTAPPLPLYFNNTNNSLLMMSSYEQLKESCEKLPNSKLMVCLNMILICEIIFMINKRKYICTDINHSQSVMKWLCLAQLNSMKKWPEKLCIEIICKFPDSTNLISLQASKWFYTHYMDQNKLACYFNKSEVSLIFIF